MKIHISNTADFKNHLETVLHGSWLSRLASFGDDIKIIFLSFGLANKKLGKGTMRTEFLLFGESTTTSVRKSLQKNKQRNCPAQSRTIFHAVKTDSYAL